VTENAEAARPRFCSECGTEFLPEARFCHNCGAQVEGRTLPRATTMSPALKWAVPGVAIVALLAVTVFRAASRPEVPATPSTAPIAAGMGAPDISSMSPVERADRLFNRVMEYWSAGKADSAAFFAPMALAAFESIGPLNAHARYDMGLVALVAGELPRAQAQSDSILAGRANHLLGLSLAARIAEARGDSAQVSSLKRRLIASEKTERASGLQEYTDHDADIRAAIDR
jgi:hypothetical protein